VFEKPIQAGHVTQISEAGIAFKISALQFDWWHRTVSLESLILQMSYVKLLLGSMCSR